VTNSSKPWGESGTDLMKSRIPPIAMLYITEDAPKRILPIDAPDEDGYAPQGIPQGPSDLQTAIDGRLLGR
jgi:hypothetical protein